MNDAGSQPGLTVVKLGGSTLQETQVVENFAREVAALRAQGHQFVVVHGGGPAINEELTRRGMTWEFFEGQRITTPLMMDVIEMVLSGTVNRRIVRSLEKNGVRAAGFSGVDHSTLLCSPADSRLEQVGVIERVDAAWIRNLLTLGVVPVIAPVGFSNDGATYNINADWAAAKVAASLGVERLVFLTDQDGIWNAEKKRIETIGTVGLKGLIESGVVAGGMLAKTRTVIHALESGVANVSILNARSPNSLIESLGENTAFGTRCLNLGYDFANSNSSEKTS